MNVVFADSFYFLALLNQNDSAHAAAHEYSVRGLAIMTTAWILTEVADAYSEPQDRAAFLNLLDTLRECDDADIVGPDAELFELGINLFRRRPDKGWSLTDCISFEVMRQANLDEALTADRHFVQAGFRAVFL
jgi:uncharacterized protein